mmetsp:Transcript_16218/g.32899  ORF Transcript_16218/g.32899 Transcript_16218/m.32899 type:complete len:655 (+) Transcript_16218:23-1987(+)
MCMSKCHAKDCRDGGNCHRFVVRSELGSDRVICLCGCFKNWHGPIGLACLSSHCSHKGRCINFQGSSEIGNNTICLCGCPANHHVKASAPLVPPLCSIDTLHNVSSTRKSNENLQENFSFGPSTGRTPGTTIIVQCPADNHWQKCEAPSSSTSVCAVGARDFIARWVPGCVHRPGLVERDADKVLGIESTWFIPIIKAIDSLIAKCDLPKFQSGWCLNGKATILEIRNVVLKASCDLQESLHFPENWDDDLRKKWNKLCLVRGRALNNAISENLDLVYGSNDNPEGRIVREDSKINEPISPEALLFCKYHALLAIFPWVLNGPVSQIPEIIKNIDFGPCFKLESKSVAILAKRVRDSSAEVSAVDDSITEGLPVGSSGETAPKRVKQEALVPNQHSNFNNGGATRSDGTSTDPSDNTSTASHEYYHNDTAGNYDGGSSHNNNNNNNNNNNSHYNYNHTTSAIANVNDVSPTDKVRAFRDAVVRWAEDHLSGVENASRLIMRLESSAQVHLPVKWINSPRIVREIIKPSVRRWLDLVQARFRQRNAVASPHRQVTEPNLNWRAAELIEAVEASLVTFPFVARTQPLPAVPNSFISSNSISNINNDGTIHENSGTAIEGDVHANESIEPSNMHLNESIGSNIMQLNESVEPNHTVS